MPKAISNTSPLLYLYRIGGIEWLPNLFEEVWSPTAVLNELNEGKQRGYDVPDLSKYDWLIIVNPRSMPYEWLSLDLGSGELTAMALALENQSHVVLLDDLLARRTSQAAGLEVWGTLRILLEAKSHRLIETIAPFVTQLENSGMWFTDDIRQRILSLAGE